VKKIERASKKEDASPHPPSKKEPPPSKKSCPAGLTRVAVAQQFHVHGVEAACIPDHLEPHAFAAFKGDVAIVAMLDHRGTVKEHIASIRS
jgi:hypothetical protein